ncbi:TonB-dependent receptor [Sphingomonas faeni]
MLLVATAGTAQGNAVQFDIRAGSLDGALRAYAKITGRQILYRAETVRALRFSGLNARLTADVALEHILAGSGLLIDHPSANVVVVREGIAKSPTASSGEPTIPIAEIVVTGTNIRGGVPTGPVRTLDRRDLERSGLGTVGELIAAQTANFGGTGNPVASLTGADQSTLNYSLAPAANLRGLGSDATLTLFDGRRVAGSGGRGDFVDLSSIPSLAIDRVEILTDGASAIYGSDAVAGVVNLVLRHRLNGVEFTSRGSVGTRGEPATFLGGAAGGKTWNGGSVLLAYEYEHRDRLSSADRAYTATGDLRPFGGSDRRRYYTSPGTILSLDRATSSYVAAYAIPELAGGRQPTAGDIQPGGNLGNLNAGADLSPKIERHAVYARVEQDLTGNFKIFADNRYAHRTFDYGSPASFTIFQVGTANPNFLRVAGMTSSVIAYDFINDFGPADVRGNVSALSATGGFEWRIGPAWTVDGYGSYARERSGDVSSNQLNSTSLNEALGNTADNVATSYSAASDGYFTPYGSGASNSQAVLNFIGAGYAIATRRSSVTDSLVRAQGPLLRLAGGNVRVAVGASFRHESFERAGESFYSGVLPVATIVTPGTRDIKAVFAELQVPIVGRENAAAGLRSLDLSLAARHEDYSDFGRTTNPKIGFAYRPANGITLRGSWGTSFRAPALSEVNDPRRVVATALTNSVRASVPTLFITGGNPDVGPERARTWSGGLVIEPDQIPGLRWEANLFSTKFRDRIAQPALEDLTRALTNPDLASYVTIVNPRINAADLATVTALLTSPGASAGTTPATSFGAIVDGRFVNTASLNVSGLDWDLRLTRPVGADQVSASISATWLFEYRRRLTPLAASVDRLDTVGNPANLRLRALATWSHRALSATLIGNYVDGYKDDVSVPNRHIDPFATIDATIALAAEKGLFAKLRPSLSVTNILDADPPFVNRTSGFGFDATNASPFGRTVALAIRYVM